MPFLEQNKWAIGGGAVCILAAGLIYYYYFTGGTSADGLTSSPTQSQTSGADLLTALGNLRAVKLDSAIFQNPVFQSLSDFGIDIPTQPVGRPNPFDPLSGGGSSSLPSNIKSGTATGKK